MWIGTYEDWTPAERREWDRDLAIMEAEREQREVTNEKKLSWRELAIEDPKFKASYTKLSDKDLYVAYLIQQTPSKQGARNLVFEVVFPLYQGLNEILEERKTSKTSLIKIQMTSWEHRHVSYTCECTPKEWSYESMDKSLAELADQLTEAQDLNGGLLIQLSFKE